MKLTHGLLILLVLALVFTGCQSEYMTSGKVYVQQGNWTKAQEQFDLEVKNNPSNGEAHAYLAEAYAKAGKYVEAGESFSKAIELTTSAKKLVEIKATREVLAVDRIKLGNGAFENGDYAKAADQYEIATQLFPEYLSAHKNMAVALLRAEKYEEAKLTWHEVLKIAPRGDAEWIQAYDVLAKLAMEDSNYTQTVAYVDTILSVKPEDIDLLSLKAGCLDAMGDHEGALAVYERILETEPDNTDALFNKAVILVKQEEIVRSSRDDREALYNLGLMAINLERWEMGKEAFQKITGLDPTNGHAWLNLGICLLNLGETKAGQEAFKKSTELGVGNHTELTTPVQASPK